MTRWRRFVCLFRDCDFEPLTDEHLTYPYRLPRCRRCGR